jgi:hypothetical protein
MIKFFSDPEERNWVIYITRLSNNKEYIITELLAQIKNILNEWDRECVSYLNYEREYNQLNFIYKKFKKNTK